MEENLSIKQQSMSRVWSEITNIVITNQTYFKLQFKAMSIHICELPATWKALK